MKRKLLIILFVLVIAFIFGQSLFSQKHSSVESEWLREHIINPIAGYFGHEEYSKDDVRKAAHSVEFFVLTLFAVYFWKGSPIRTIYTGFTIAFLDESMQMITGRGALVRDIWIDLIGVGLGAVIGCGIYQGFRRTRK